MGTMTWYDDDEIEIVDQLPENNHATMGDRCITDETRAREHDGTRRQQQHEN